MSCWTRTKNSWICATLAHRCFFHTLYAQRFTLYLNRATMAHILNMILESMLRNKMKFRYVECWHECCLKILKAQRVCTRHCIGGFTERSRCAYRQDIKNTFLWEQSRSMSVGSLLRIIIYNIFADYLPRTRDVIFTMIRVK